MKYFLVLSLLLLIGTGCANQIEKSEEKNQFKADTVEEREKAAKLSKDECSCWDGVNNICLPQVDCI